MPEVDQLLRDIASTEASKENLLAFATRTIPKYETPRHIRYLAGLLERVERGEITRLAISAPPGSGKSSLLSAYAAWWIGRHPRENLLILSASEALAVRNSRLVRGIVQDEKYPWDLKIAGDQSSVLAWSTTTGTEIRSFGTGAVLSGFRGSCAICDDLQPDGMTGPTRDTLEQWFRSVLETRMNVGTAGMSTPIILVNTRWSTDDLYSRLASGDDANAWTFVNLEAVCESVDDPLHRDIGMPLWPERWPVATMLAKKAAVGSLVWDSLYMGRPRPEGGRVFLESYFANRYDVLPSPPALPFDPSTRFYLDPLAAARQTTPQQFLRITALDAAGKQTASGSYSAICSVMADDRSDVYLLECERCRDDFEALRQRLLRHCERWTPDALVIENASMGARMIGSLQASNFRIPIIAVEPTKSKEERALRILPLCESGKMHLPTRASWLDAFLREIYDWPASKFSDQTDAWVYATTYVLETQLRRQYVQNFDKHLQEVTQGWFAR